MKKGDWGGKIFFLLFFGLFICTVGGSLLDSCIKLYKVDKVYTDTCIVKCTDYELHDNDDYFYDSDSARSDYVECFFTYTGKYHDTNITFKSNDTESCNDAMIEDFKDEFWLTQKEKKFLKKVKDRLGTTKILNVNPKNPKDHICVEEEKANIISIVGTCGFSFIYIFFVLLIIWLRFNHPTKREIEKTNKQRELVKKNEQDNIEKMMKVFDKELLKEKGKDDERRLDMYTGEYKTFVSYAAYHNFIMQSRERKDKRFM